MRIAIAAIAGAAFTGGIALADSAEMHFFPSRPSGATLSSVSGVLTNWSHGEGTGTISVLDSSGKTHTFYMGYPAKINGTAVTCFHAPGTSGSSSPDPYCTDWPSGIVLNSTKIKAVYWSATLNGTTVQASDEVDSQ